MTRKLKNNGCHSKILRGILLVNKEGKFLSTWYLVKQPIYYVKSTHEDERGQVFFYEILLRSKVTNRFPFEEFNSLIATKHGNQLFFNWLKSNLTDFFNQFTNKTVLSINIEPKQLVTGEFVTFLDELDDFKEKLIIEVTERLPNSINTVNFVHQLKAIFDKGYYILIDDVDILNHRTKPWKYFARYVNGFKLSPIAVKICRKQEFVELVELITELQLLNNIQLIGEGAENHQIMETYIELGINYQQGWYLGKEELLFTE